MCVPRAKKKTALFICSHGARKSVKVMESEDRRKVLRPCEILSLHCEKGETFYLPCRRAFKIRENIN